MYGKSASINIVVVGTYCAIVYIVILSLDSKLYVIVDIFYNLLVPPIIGYLCIIIYYDQTICICSHSGGISIQGSLKLDTDLVTDEVDFALITEGFLHMYSDAEFDSKIVLCMQIVFEDTNVT